jgi:hypothetical protein
MSYLFLRFETTHLKKKISYVPLSSVLRLHFFHVPIVFQFPCFYFRTFQTSRNCLAPVVELGQFPWRSKWTYRTKFECFGPSWGANGPKFLGSFKKCPWAGGRWPPDSFIATPLFGTPGKYDNLYGTHMSTFLLFQQPLGFLSVEQNTQTRWSSNRAPTERSDKARQQYRSRERVGGTKH